MHIFPSTTPIVAGVTPLDRTTSSTDNAVLEIKKNFKAIDIDTSV